MGDIDGLFQSSFKLSVGDVNDPRGLSCLGHEGYGNMHLFSCACLPYQYTHSETVQSNTVLMTVVDVLNHVKDFHCCGFQMEPIAN